MIARAALAALLVLLPSGRALACPEPSATLLWHSCWGESEISVLLLPEDLPLTASGGSPGAGDGVASSTPVPGADASAEAARGPETLIVTGAYTSRETRGEGHPAPVGLFVRAGEIVGRNLARMDGLLVVQPDGSGQILHRDEARIGGEDFDLRNYPERVAFLKRAAQFGLSVLQSHLLVIDGEIDVSPDEAAPSYTRRILFEDAHGIGLWQSRWPMTLHDAAERVARGEGARMAMNLDMGSYDFCLRVSPGGREEVCGVVQPGAGTGKLSNAIALRLRRAPL